MEIIEAIMTRRSIRTYKDMQVSIETMEMLLKAGMQAPSARNEQPWYFTVIRERRTLDEVPSFHPYAQMMKSAPAAILVCGDLQIEKSIDYVVEDCSAATQNVLLAAHGLGLGAVWLGIHPREERVAGIRNLLSIPESVLPVALIAVGYPDEDKSPADRFLPQRVFYEKWGQSL